MRQGSNRLWHKRYCDVPSSGQAFAGKYWIFFDNSCKFEEFLIEREADSNEAGE